MVTGTEGQVRHVTEHAVAGDASVTTGRDVNGPEDERLDGTPSAGVRVEAT